jgi:hypothetical protein
MLAVFAPAVDDSTYLNPQISVTMFNTETKSVSPDSAQPNPSEFREQSIMQLDVTNLMPEAHEAIVECLRIAARRGRMLREAREREQAARQTGSPQGGLVDNSIQPTSIDEQPSHAVSMEPSSSLLK